MLLYSRRFVITVPETRAWPNVENSLCDAWSIQKTECHNLILAAIAKTGRCQTRSQPLRVLVVSKLFFGPMRERWRKCEADDCDVLRGTDSLKF